MDQLKAKAPPLAGVVGSLAGVFLFGAVSVLTLVYGRQVKQEGEASARWPTVRGEIKSGRVEESRSDSGVSYLVRLAYDYRVGGETHRGHTVYYHAAASFSQRSKAEEFLAKHPVGHVLDVHVDPADPKRSVLYGGATAEGPFLMCFGSFAGLLALLALVSGVRGYQRAARELS